MPSPKYQVYNLLETYHELGEYSFKVVLNPRFYKAAHQFRVQMFDSANMPMQHELEIWGRKLNIRFLINPSVSDGVAYLDIFRDNTKMARLTFWVIKP